MTYLYIYLAVALLFLFMDGLWLGFMGEHFYRPRLGDRMLDKPRLGIAGVFYIFYAVAIVVLAIHPADSAIHAAGLGAILGAAAYGTYDVTNLATLKNWPTSVSIVDTLWGTFITVTCSAVGYFVGQI